MRGNEGDCVCVRVCPCQDASEGAPCIYLEPVEDIIVLGTDVRVAREGGDSDRLPVQHGKVVAVASVCRA